MKFLKFKPLGLRNIKTTVSVLICLLLIKNTPIYAAVAAIICMQSTVENSVKIGKTRLIGTLIGGILGISLLALTRTFNLNSYIPFITAFGVCMAIYISNIINIPAASAITSIVVISIILAPSGTNPVSYAITRTIETAIGIIIAILVNKYFKLPNFIKKLKIKLLTLTSLK